MRTRQKMNFIVSVIISLMLITFSSALAVDYAKPVALDKGAQASFDQIKQKKPENAARCLHAARHRIQLLHRHW